jgi:uncharacterized protein YndB with AHSA1/START domain
MARWIAAAVAVALASPVQEDEKRLAHEAEIGAPVADVWAALTTKAGMESWMVAHAEIDLKIGGVMRTHYDPKGKLGDAKTIENTILSFDPHRMLSIKATKIPEGFPFPNAIRDMWTVMYFEDAGAGKTRVKIVSLGLGDDEEATKMKSFFKRGNQLTLDRLRKKFEK